MNTKSDYGLISGWRRLRPRRSVPWLRPSHRCLDWGLAVDAGAPPLQACIVHCTKPVNAELAKVSVSDMQLFFLSPASMRREHPPVPPSACLVRLVHGAVTKGGVEEENENGTGVS